MINGNQNSNNNNMMAAMLPFEETITYKDYTITKDASGFWVRIPEFFSGLLYHETLEAAKKYIDYVINNRHKWN